jgi:protocatechuate 3,4-dioxygenase beta subunit
VSTILTALLLATIGANPSDSIVRGTVTDPDGSPVDGAEVYVTSTAMGDYVAEGVTGKDGSFSVPLPQTSSAEFQLFDRYISVAAVKVGWGVGGKSGSEPTATRYPVDIQLTRARAVACEILDPEGAPLPNAHVTFKWSPDLGFSLPGEHASQLTSTTDKAGRCAIGFVPESAVQLGLVIRSERYGRQQARIQPGGGDRVTIRLAPVGSIRGQVVAGDVRAVANLKVEIQSRPLQTQAVYWAREFVQTDQEGRFEVPALIAGKVSIRVQTRKELPWRVVERIAADLKEGENKQLAIQLVRGVRFAGAIVDNRSSAPIQNLPVHVLNSDTHENYELTTDENGRFEVYVAPGKVHVSPQDLPRPFSDWITPREGLKIEPGTTEYTPDPFVLPQRATIRGTVVDDKERPIANAWVTAHWNQNLPGGSSIGPLRSVKCDKDGRFEFGPVPGDLAIRLRAASQSAASTEFVVVLGADKNDVTLTVSPAGSVFLSGQVVDERSRPLKNAHVALQLVFGRSIFNEPRDVRSRELDSEWTLSTDEDGRFAFPDPLPRLERFQLSVEMPGRATYTNRDLSLENAGASVELPAIELGSIRRFEGVVLDDRGRPVAAARIAAKGLGQRSSMATVLTDQLGRFELKDVHPSACFVFAEADDDYLLQGAYVTGTEGPITIQLRRRGNDTPVTIANPDEYLVPSPRRQELLKEMLLPLLERGRRFENQSVQRRVLTYLAAVDPELVLAEMESITSPNSRFLLLIDLGLVDEAVELVEQMDTPYSRSFSYVTAAQAVESPDRKLEYLARALTNGREVPTPENRVIAVAHVAEELERLGQVDTARRLLEEFLPTVGQLSKEGRNPFAKGYFATRLALFDPDKALQLIPDMIERRLARHAGNIAHILADRNPKMAERALDMIPQDYQKRSYAPRVGYRMATVDPDRAVKIADFDRYYALSVVAYALRDKDPAKSRDLMRTATSGSGFRDSHGAKLPYVAAVDPTTLSDVLWRSVAYETLARSSAGDRLLRSTARAVILLKMYGDPQVADQLGKTFLNKVFRLPPAYRERSPGSVNAIVVAAMTLLDPDGAVEWHNEHLPNATENDLRLSYPEPPYDVIASLLSKSRQDVEKYLQSIVFRVWVIDQFDH